MSNDIKFRLLGDVKDLEDKMSKSKKSFDALGKTSSVAFAALTASAFGFIGAAREQESALNALNQALKNSGNYTDEASKGLQRYATELQRASLFGDEVVVQAQARFAAFGFEAEEIKRLTAATLDLAQAKEMDLVSAADLVSKSVASTTNAMSRYGIEITGTAGSAERVTSAIAGLNKVFGGQAKAATEGLGSIKQMQDALSDVAEEIGLALAPQVIDLAKNIKSLAQYMQDNPFITQTAAEFIKLGLVVTGAVAGIWAINTAFVSVGATLTGILPTLNLIARHPVFLAGVAATSVYNLAKASYDWGAAVEYANKEIAEQQRVLEESFAARGVTAKQVQSDAVMRIDIIKSISAAEVEAAQIRLDSEKRVNQDILSMQSEMQAIAATITQQELSDLIESFNLKRDAEISFIEMKRLMMAENNALTKEQEILFNDEMSEIKAKYAMIEYQAKEQLQAKMSALDKKGYDIAKKVNEDKVASLQSTLQQAAQLNSKFANAYKAVAIGEAIMSTASGVARAFKDYPFPASLGVAALVGAAGAVQIATIAQQSFAVGTPEIPRDMTATVHRKEMIVPATFAEGIRSGDLSLSGGGSSGSGIVFDFSGTVFNGVTQGFVQEIFEKASEYIRNRTLIFRGA